MKTKEEIRKAIETRINNTKGLIQSVENALVKIMSDDEMDETTKQLEKLYHQKTYYAQAITLQLELVKLLELLDCIKDEETNSMVEEMLKNSMEFYERKLLTQQLMQRSSDVITNLVSLWEMEIYQKMRIFCKSLLS